MGKIKVALITKSVGELETQSAFTVRRGKTFEPKLAGLAEEVRADFTLLKGAEENPPGRREQAGKIGFALKAELGADRRHQLRARRRRRAAPLQCRRECTALKSEIP